MTDKTRIQHRLVYEEAYEEASKIRINDNIPGDIYGINIIEDRDFEINIITLSMYAEIDYVDENVEQYEDIEITRFVPEAEIVN